MPNDYILIVDDDAGFRSLLETILAGEGYEVTTAATVEEAKLACERKHFHLILSDLKLPDGDGLELLKWAREAAPSTPFLMITAYGTVGSAVEAMKLGAVDYLGKPLSSPDELRLLVQRTLERTRRDQERDMLRAEQKSKFACGDLISYDPQMQLVRELVGKVAPTDASVLITGESGTGKEIIARCIHNNSPRAGKAFVAVNCASLSPTLIESELFGHERGAFTGAQNQHIGRFERAHGGTLFLDEIGELDSGLQTKLLRVLQDHTFERVGGTRVIKTDARVIAATNRDLEKRVEDGQFRRDLYYRLNQFPVTIPPLRERRADILPLARFFLERGARALRKPGLQLAPDAETKLLEYGWPGNVRELENLMERMAILCEGQVRAEDLPLAATTNPVRMKDLERRAIEEALRVNRGNRVKASRQLGISLRTLQYRLKEYGLTRPLPSHENHVN